MLFLQVKLSVFWEYAKSLTVPISVCIVLFFILSETSAVSSGIWLAKWSSTDVTSDDERDLFLGVYGALGLSQAIFILFASIAMAAGSRVASRYLHQKMLVNIMHSPMSLFETTPQGRIMNRFSKDISGIDDMVPRSLTSFLRTFLSVIGTMFAITFATPIFLAVIIPLGALYFFIQVRPLFAWNPVNRFFMTIWLRISPAILKSIWLSLFFTIALRLKCFLTLAQFFVDDVFLLSEICPQNATPITKPFGKCSPWLNSFLQSFIAVSFIA